jgi:preprotein translocase subunit SecG
VRGANRRFGFGRGSRGVYPMLDVVMLVMGIGFFVLSIAYAVACDWL